MTPLRVVVALALVLRLGRAALRWDEIALAYVAYQQPWLDAAARWDLQGMVATTVGLHPPLYSALLGLVMAVWPAPAAWLALSAGLSTAAVIFVGRAFGWPAALVLAVDPLQLAYAGELNNYPLLAASTAACLAARERAAAGGSWAPLALAGVVAGWSHVLGGVVGGIHALTLLPSRPRAAAGALGWMAVGTAPVLALALRLAGSEGTYGQGGFDGPLLLRTLVERGGAGLALIAAAALAGAWRRPAVAVVAAGSAAAILGMVGAGVAASHQVPYWLVVGPPLAALAASWWGLGSAVGVLALGLGVPAELQRGRRLTDDLRRPRSIDAALGRSEPGDALWLLSPALEPDDDKAATSPVLWRLAPWEPMPAWTGAFEYVDYAYGQPRLWRDRVVHTSTGLSLAHFDAMAGRHLAAGGRLWVVLYDHAPARDLARTLDVALRPYAATCADVGEDRGLGVDRLCRVEGLR